MEISPKGGRWWRFKYRLDSKEKRIALDVYPEFSLKDAREARDQARRLGEWHRPQSESSERHAHRR